MPSQLTLLILFFCQTLLPFVAQAQIKCNDLYLSTTQSEGTALVPLRSEVTKNLRVSQFSDANEDLILFRSIKGPYIKNTIGNFAKAEGNYTYTLGPFYAVDWGIKFLHTKDVNILIAKQNLKSDGLLRRDPETGEFLFLNGSSRVPDLGEFNEVRVPFGGENVLFIVPLQDFLNILDSIGKPYATLTEILVAAQKALQGRAKDH